MSGALQDLRHSARALLRRPGFSAVVVLTLGLGIGANSAIFALLDQVVVRPLPVRAPQELFLLHSNGPVSGFTDANKSFPRAMSFPMYVDFRDRVPAFAGVLAYYPLPLHIGLGGATERAQGELVSGNYFDVLGLAPAAGRLLRPEDDRQPLAHPLAVLSHDFWQRRFGGQAGVLNQTILLNGHPFTVVGVAPPGFQGLEVGRTPDVFVPLMMKAWMTPTWDKLDDRRAFWLMTLARLKPGVGRARAESEAQVVFSQVLQQEVTLLTNVPEASRQRFLARRIQLVPGAAGASGLREAAGPPLAILMATVATVLLIACANVAGLLLARATARQRETAIRLSLGASRYRLVRHLLTESLLLSLAGGLLGLLVAGWAGGLLVQALPDDSGSLALTSAPDLRVVAFTFTLSALVALLCGLLPALQSTARSLQPALRGGGTVAGPGRSGRARRVLVVAQVALSLLLLVGAGLFTRSLARLESVSPGFETERLLMFSVNPALNGYADARQRATLREIEAALRGVSGVQAAGASDLVLLANDVTSSTVRVDGRPHRETDDPNPQVNVVSPSYFATLGIPLLAGRGFDDRDTLGAPRVAVVNESFARYFFEGQSPVGHRLGLGRSGPADIEIVGLVRDARSDRLQEQARGMFLPWAQRSEVGAMAFYVRTRGDEAAAAAGVRQAVARVDPALPLSGLKTMRAQAQDSVFTERLVAFLAAVFSGLATLLAALGLYGVISYNVEQRRRELGVRMALGATRRDLLGLVLREVGRLGGLGLAVGLPLALLAAQLVRSQVYRLSPFDPFTLAGAVTVLAAVTLLAGLVPARRATRVDPMAVLRHE